MAATLTAPVQAQKSLYRHNPQVVKSLTPPRAEGIATCSARSASPTTRRPLADSTIVARVPKRHTAAKKTFLPVTGCTQSRIGTSGR